MAVILEVWRGTWLAVEKPTMISPEPCAANEPMRPMPSAARLQRRTSCDDSSGASVAMTVMIEPALRSRRGGAERRLQHLADRRAVDAQRAHDAEVRLHQDADGVVGRPRWRPGASWCRCRP